MEACVDQRSAAGRIDLEAPLADAPHGALVDDQKEVAVEVIATNAGVHQGLNRSTGARGRDAEHDESAGGLDDRSPKVARFGAPVECQHVDTGVVIE